MAERGDHDDLIRELVDVLPTWGDGEREWLQAEAVLNVFPEIAHVIWLYRPTQNQEGDSGS